MFGLDAQILLHHRRVLRELLRGGGHERECSETGGALASAAGTTPHMLDVTYGNRLRALELFDN